MRTRLGHLSLDQAGRPTDITISRRHLAAHGWDEAEQTLLHEMVHLWQWVIGHTVDHGPQFRAKAREVGVAAAARRWVTSKRKPTHVSAI
jgi:predicted SprT family Zn-dependent metalloprotease